MTFEQPINSYKKSYSTYQDENSRDTYIPKFKRNSYLSSNTHKYPSLVTNHGSESSSLRGSSYQESYREPEIGKYYVKDSKFNKNQPKDENVQVVYDPKDDFYDRLSAKTRQRPRPEIEQKDDWQKYEWWVRLNWLNEIDLF